MNNITQKQTLYACIGSFFIGMLFFAWHNEMIIFRLPTKHLQLSEQNTAQKKSLTLQYLKDNAWQTVTKDMIFTHDTNQNFTHVLQQLSTVLLEETILIKPFVLQDCIYTPSHELYISFSKNPLAKQNSIEEKSIIIESILATLRSIDTPIKLVSFFVDHQPMVDTQLDFSKSWPIEGFIQKETGV